MEQRPVFIYGLVDPESAEVRYVGKTVMLRARLNEHIGRARRGGKDYRSRWIRSVLARNQKPAITVLEVADDTTWEEAERRQIALFRSQGVSLTNATPGGEVGCRTLTIDEVDNLADLYASGMSMKEVGRRFNVTAGTVCHILNSGNYDHITIRPKTQIRRKDGEQVMEARRLYASGVGLTALSEQFGLSIPVLTGIVKGSVRSDLPMVPDELGAAERRRNAGERHSSAVLSDEQVTEIVAHAIAGESQRSIAKRYGVAYQTVCKIAHGESRVGVAKNGQVLAKRSLHRFTAEEVGLVVELRASGMTLQRIADVIGGSETQVRNIAKAREPGRY